jgi:CheY-like chemotaxis protein
MAIEDNPADVDLLRMALDNANFAYEMTVINDGAVAIGLFRQSDTGDFIVPDITVLDLNLPKYDGMEILEAARSNPLFAAMPIAILSSSSSPREQSRIQMFSAVKYITKPPDLDQYLGIGSIIRDFVKASLLSRGSSA